MRLNDLIQWFLVFLPPGTGFMEDSFSTDKVWGGDGFRMIRGYSTYYATTDLTGGRAQAIMQAMGSGCKYK